MGCEGFLAHEWRGAAEIFALPSCMCFCLPHIGLGSAGVVVKLEAQNHLCLHHSLLTWEVLSPEEPVSTGGGGVNPELIHRQLSVTLCSPSPHPVSRQLPGGEEVRKLWGLAGLAWPLAASSRSGVRPSHPRRRAEEVVWDKPAHTEGKRLGVLAQGEEGRCPRQGGSRE